MDVCPSFNIYDFKLAYTSVRTWHCLNDPNLSFPPILDPSHHFLCLTLRSPNHHSPCLTLRLQSWSGSGPVTQMGAAAMKFWGHPVASPHKSGSNLSPLTTFVFQERTADTVSVFPRTWADTNSQNKTDTPSCPGEKHGSKHQTSKPQGRPQCRNLPQNQKPQWKDPIPFG